MNEPSNIGVVVIGRNEGERLKRCLRSLPNVLPVVYVDSGSTDGSVEFARSVGVTVVELDMHVPFTAARARNAGWHHLSEIMPTIKFVQFVDGDCEIHSDWVACAEAALVSEPQAAVVFGRLRERFPHSSLYNRICDREWDMPVGIADYCGGNAMMRLSGLNAVEGFQDDLIAGEEPDLCLRMGQQGFHVRRIDCEMGLHDAAMFAFKSWWNRTKRSGFAYAQHVFSHGRAAIPAWRRQLASILTWAFALPLIGLGLTVALRLPFTMMITIFLAMMALIYGLQIVRIAARELLAGEELGFAAASAGLLVLGKLPQFIGVLTFLLNRIFQRTQSVIEHRPKI
jgi:GT2 family glycosyltransferase